MAEARAHGFSDAMVNEALAGVEPREQVISEDRNQAEVVQTLEQYYRIRVSPTMVERGLDLTRFRGRVRTWDHAVACSCLLS